MSWENKIFDLTLPKKITFVPRAKKVNIFFPDSVLIPPAHQRLPFYETIIFFHIAAGFDGLGGYQDGVGKIQNFVFVFLDLGTKVIKFESVKSKILFSQDTLMGLVAQKLTGLISADIY